jgi:transposase, IS30 family
MNQITCEQRYTISVMLNQGYTKTAIALTLGKHKSTIGREIKRNSDGRNGKYSCELAQRKCSLRHKDKTKHKRLNPPLLAYIKENLENKLSPEQIYGQAKLQGIDCVSHERIYQLVWEDKKRNGSLHKHLRNQGRRYKKRGALKVKRGIIPNRKDISLRPEVVEERKRFGDIEIDTIIGKNHKGAFVTINDRATGVLRMVKVETRNYELVAQKTIEQLLPWKGKLKTITSDNGLEFRDMNK